MLADLPKINHNVLILRSQYVLIFGDVLINRLQWFYSTTLSFFISCVFYDYLWCWHLLFWLLCITKWYCTGDFTQYPEIKCWRWDIKNHIELHIHCLWLLKNWMFNFVSLLKYKRQMTGNRLCKPAQRSGAGLRIICYPSSDVYTSINLQRTCSKLSFTLA